MARGALSLTWVSLTGLWLVACGQTEPPVASGYFPMRDGSSWTYLHSKGGWSELVTLEKMAGESDLFEQKQSGDPEGESSRSELRVVDGDVLRVAEDLLRNDVLVYSTVYEPGFLRFSEAWADGEVGDTNTAEYDRTETDVGEDPSAAQPRAHRFTIEALSETVTVPAGTFPDCLRIRRERALDLVPDAGAANAQEEQEKLFWFAAGVGKVREENVITRATELLTTYEVPEE